MGNEQAAEMLKTTSGKEIFEACEGTNQKGQSYDS